MNTAVASPAASSTAATPLLRVRNLVKHFPLKGKRVDGKPAVVRAVDDIDFDVLEGETLGVVGESGCGKSTTARLLMHLINPDAGEIVFDGKVVGSRELSLREFRRQVQMVFQDSYASLNPRLTVAESIAFGPMVHGESRDTAERRARDLLERVGLSPARFAERYPHELSGGQRQRVNIARALALQPRLLILDEATSALDKSVEAQVLNLLVDLKADFGLTYLFISHDLHVVRYLSDRVMVMYLGEVAELAPSQALFETPHHPYARALLASMPTLDPDRRTEQAPLAGDPPNPVNPPSGCRFHTRCVFAEPLCSQRAASLAPATARSRESADPLHVVACHMMQAGSGHSQTGLSQTAPSGAATEQVSA